MGHLSIFSALLLLSGTCRAQYEGGGPPQQQFGGPPQEQFGGQPQGQFGGQPQEQFGGQPQGQFSGQPQGQFGGQPQGQFGGQPQGQFGGQSQGQFGGQPQEQFGGQPGGLKIRTSFSGSKLLISQFFFYFLLPHFIVMGPRELEVQQWLESVERMASANCNAGAIADFNVDTDTNEITEDASVPNQNNF
jgi:hypothetical protein